MFDSVSIYFIFDTFVMTIYIKGRMDRWMKGGEREGGLMFGWVRKTDKQGQTLRGKQRFVRRERSREKGKEGERNGEEFVG